MRALLVLPLVLALNQLDMTDESVLLKLRMAYCGVQLLTAALMTLLLSKVSQRWRAHGADCRERR